MKHILPIAAFVAATCSLPVQASPASPQPAGASQSHFRVLSPDRLTFLEIQLTGGRLTYTAGYRQVRQAAVAAGKNAKKAASRDTVDVPLLERSPLGLTADFTDWTQGLVVTGHQDGTRSDHYTLRKIKQSEVDYQANTFRLDLQNEQKHSLSVEFQVSNSNIAFRYHLPQQGERAAVVIKSEATGFDFPAGTTTFICPQSDPMIGWKRTKPSYEEEYTLDGALTAPSRYGHGWTFPCLFHEGDRGWVLVSETGVTSDFCASHLSDATPSGLFTIAFPMEGENNGFGSTGAQMGLPATTPWRTLTLGRTLQPIVETTVTWDVVEQLYEPVVPYTTARNTWSWIVWQDPSINYADQVTFINLAADLGWEGCLIDGGWLTNIGREGMEKLFAYCKQKGVRPWVWYNSNGGWNDAPQCAKQCMHNPIVRKREMAWLLEHGVQGIKVDFFAGDKQETMRLYESILSDANDYGLQVIFHGCTLPRGWERMYPNYVSSEAVLASENLIFNQHFCDLEAQNACLHPFVRNTVGAMEFGGTLLQRRLNREANGGTTRRTSDIFELATAVAFQSCVQNFALTPRDLEAQPKFEIDFMRQVPTTWDETRFIDGYPGRYLVLARRHGTEWFVVAMNAEQQAKTLTLQLPMFKAQTGLVCLSDGDDGRTPTQAPLRVDKKSCVTITVQPQCAVILMN